MTKEDFIGIITDTYKKAVEDNVEDFQKLFWIISKLCTYLSLKGVLTESEMKDILKIEVPGFKDKEVK